MRYIFFCMSELHSTLTRRMICFHSAYAYNFHPQSFTCSFGCNYICVVYHVKPVFVILFSLMNCNKNRNKNRQLLIAHRFLSP